MQNTTCCFIGHREIEETEKLTKSLTAVIETLILKNGVDTFLFGSKSRFDSLCYRQVSELKIKYPHIKRIYVRAEYPEIDDAYKNYLLTLYEDTYYAKNAVGKAVYVERNREMIDKSCFCVFYYRESALPKGRKSGTALAIAYAKKLKKEIFVLTD